MKSKQLYTAGKSPAFKTIGDLVAWAALSGLVDGNSPIRLNGREIGRVINDYTGTSEQKPERMF